MEDIFMMEKKKMLKQMLYDANYEELGAEIDKATCFDRKVED